MNLNAYDFMIPNFTTTWIVPENKKLYSNVIEYYPYYTFLKRYNRNNKSNDYYIAFSNKETTNCVWYKTYTTKSHSIKIDLSPIWDNSNFKYIEDKQEINIEVDSKFDDGIVYFINI